MNKEAPDNILNVILQIIYSNPGINDEQLKLEISKHHQIEEKARLYYLKSLNNSGHLKIAKNERGLIIYSYQDPEKTMQLAKLEHEEKVVFELIEKSGPGGLSKMDIKKKLGMHNMLVNGALKKLEKLDLVKFYKAKNKNRNMYILAEIEPDAELLGGVFYSNGKLNDQMIQEMTNKIEQFIFSSNRPSKTDLENFVANNLAVGKELKRSDVQTLINVLILDDRIEDISTLGESRYAISRNKDAFDTHLINGLPCLTCPVNSECRTGFKISPENCIYLNDW